MASTSARGAEPSVKTMRFGLDRLLGEPSRLARRRYGLLAHAASLSAELEPAHLALAGRGVPPAVLFGPEHGYYAVEQDMVAAADQVDPLSGVPIVSLYGDAEASLRPRPEAFSGLDLVVIDLQDVGARYYTFAATAAWTAQAALAARCQVLILDRPNPLDGVTLEGNLPAADFASFVGAFRVPVRHGLTLAELVLLAAWREAWPGWQEGIEVLAVEGWRREHGWAETGRSWVAPSPNMPTVITAGSYPGGCLAEATELSEGRGTARPFQLFGAPGLDPLAFSRRLGERLERQGITSLAVVPTFFRPQFQKHRGAICGGVELVPRDAHAVASFRAGCELLGAAAEVWSAASFWRSAPYEFVIDRPAIDLLAGDATPRRAIDALRRGERALADDALDAWYATWPIDEASFRAERAEILLYR